MCRLLEVVRLLAIHAQVHARHCLAAGFGNRCVAVFAMRQARALMQLAPRTLDRIFDGGIDLVLHRPITRPSGRHDRLGLLAQKWNMGMRAGKSNPDVHSALKSGALASGHSHALRKSQWNNPSTRSPNCSPSWACHRTKSAFATLSMSTLRCRAICVWKKHPSGPRHRHSCCVKNASTMPTGS
ncbi:hypothetical protein XHV734_1476 [Xanthomonas hortorum pv. vitians]|nr:hypothetical protein XHV734_1476 [Xanthomonas hortorum pv. vitians]